MATFQDRAQHQINQLDKEVLKRPLLSTATLFIILSNFPRSRNQNDADC